MGELSKTIGGIGENIKKVLEGLNFNPYGTFNTWRL